MSNQFKKAVIDDVSCRSIDETLQANLLDLFEYAMKAVATTLELGRVVERLPRCHTQCAVLLGHAVRVEEFFTLQYRLLGRFQHGIKPPQYGEGKDHVTVLAAHVDVAQAVVSDIPDEVSNPLQVALVLLFYGFH